MVLAVAYLGPVPEEIGYKVIISEAYAMPEFWQGGRNHFFDSDIDFLVTSLIFKLSILTHNASSLSLIPLHFSQSDSL